MTFDEWLDSYETTYGATLDDDEVHSAQDAWVNSGVVHTTQATAAQRAPMPCGHPTACIVSDDEGTGYCGWCAEVDRVRQEEQEERERLMGLIQLAIDNLSSGNPQPASLALWLKTRTKEADDDAIRKADDAE